MEALLAKDGHLGAMRLLGRVADPVSRDGYPVAFLEPAISDRAGARPYQLNTRRRIALLSPDSSLLTPDS